MLKPGLDYIGVGVGALIIDPKGLFLLALRAKEVKNEAGFWEIPGGAMEFGEHFDQALKREIKEELGIDIKIEKLLHIVNHIIPKERQHWISPTFICRITAGIPRIMEPKKCAEIGWFSLDNLPQPISIITQSDIKYLRLHPDRLLPHTVAR